MKNKNKRLFEDKAHKKVTRSSERRESKSKRHHTKDVLHNLANSNVDNDDFLDIMDKLEDTDWSY